MRVSGLLIAALVSLVAGPSCARNESGGSGRPSDPPNDSAVATVPAVPGEPENPLIGALRASFQARNPKLTRVGILDLDAWDFKGPRVVLGWAIVGDYTFRGDFKDEMFGVFVVDESLTRVERAVDLFETPRWYDYHVRFGRLTGDSVEVLGRGDTYGDGPMRRAYKWAVTSP